MRALLKLVSINTLLCIFGLNAPIYSSELKNFIFPNNNLNDNLIASNSNVKTVITKGFGATINTSVGVLYRFRNSFYERQRN